MRGRFRFKVLLACCVLLAGAGRMEAQTTAEVNAGVVFNFSTPGARSLGMGGAFVGLADDATAAYANPAGLTILSEPEISFEVRNWDYTTTFVESGRLPSAGSPTGTGVDTAAGLRNGKASDTLTGLSFLSAVYPGRNWAVALYRHELANYETAFQTSGAFNRPEQHPRGRGRTRPKINTFDLEIVNVGLAAAVRLGDRLSLGAGLSSYDFSLQSRTDRYQVSQVSGTLPGQFFGPPLYTAGNLVDSQLQSGDDRQAAFNAGFLWNLADGWTLGGVYRQGPEFEMDAIYIPSPTAPVESWTTRPSRYDTPDVFGLGIAVQPGELTTATLDVVRIEYSDLTRSFTNILLLRPTEDFLLEDLHNFQVDDVLEVHLGFEQIFPLGRSLLAARLGAWYDPDHRIRYLGRTLGLQAAFQPGSDEVHYAAGFGYISTRLKLQADAAFDYSDPVKTASISAVVRF